MIPEDGGRGPQAARQRRLLVKHTHNWSLVSGTLSALVWWTGEPPRGNTLVLVCVYYYHVERVGMGAWWAVFGRQGFGSMRR